jgi:hypothetical protein
VAPLVVEHRLSCEPLCHVLFDIDLAGPVDERDEKPRVFSGLQQSWHDRRLEVSHLRRGVLPRRDLALHVAAAGERPCPGRRFPVGVFEKL